MKILQRILKGQKGLTLTELVVVAAILGILAALTAVAVTGTASTAKGAAKTTDESEVGKAAQAFAGTEGTGAFPVDGLSSPITYTVTTSVASALGLTAGDYNAIDFSADDGDGKLFNPGYLASVKHSSKTFDHDDDGDSGTPEINVWLIDPLTGNAFVAIPDGNY